MTINRLKKPSYLIINKEAPLMKDIHPTLKALLYD